MWVWFFIVILFSNFKSFAAEISLCQDVQVRSNVKMSFSTTEKKWVCGDSENSAWQVVPVWQKEFYLRNFLQSRGYHHPQFTNQNGVLIVEVGEKAKLKAWRVSDEYPGFKSHKRRAWLNRDLTPELLNEMESWSKSRLGEVGYPCAKAKSLANPETGEVEIKLEPGPSFLFPSPDQINLPENNQLSSINRYAAFNEGRLFDERLLKLSSSRMLLDEYILSAFFEVTCQENLKIAPRLISGDPQIVAAGGGYNTEMGPIAQVRYKHTHLDHAGSNFESILFLSQREQSLKNSFTVYQGEPYQSRFFWRPEFNVKNEIEAQYEAYSLELGAVAGLTYELSDAKLEISGGPSYLYSETKRSSTSILRTVTAETQLALQSHDHEYYMGNPFTGYSVLLNSFSGFKNLGASQNFHQLNISGQSLWNLGDWTPPIAILGIRAKAGTFILDDVDNFGVDIPETYRFFLGGDATLRGFGRKQIGGSDNGAISYIYTGLELREGEVFLGSFQPFIFVDLGWIGEQTFTVNPETYWSPGVGVRWATFIGPVRASVARGFLNSESDPLENAFVYYISLGSEF